MSRDIITFGDNNSEIAPLIDYDMEFPKFRTSLFAVRRVARMGRALSVHPEGGCTARASSGARQLSNFQERLSLQITLILTETQEGS